MTAATSPANLSMQVEESPLPERERAAGRAESCARMWRVYRLELFLSGESYGMEAHSEPDRCSPGDGLTMNYKRSG